MKILVTGSNGFLGSALVARLLAHGEDDIRCLVRPGSQKTKLDKLDKEQPGKLEIFRGTLARPDDCKKMLGDPSQADGPGGGVKVIYHLAAAMGGAPADMFLNSVVSSKNLLEAVVAHDPSIKIVLCSSFGVYGVSNLPSGHTVDESTPLEAHPEKRDPYSHTKLRQEQLFWEYQRKFKFPLVVMRPGVIYGPGGPPMSGRVGLNLFGIYLHLGRNNLIPLSYVDNCAEAIVVAGQSDKTAGQVYNVHDDELPSAKAFLKLYRKNVKKMPYVTMPWFATNLLSIAVEKYHAFSKGQLPAVFTPYKSAAQWKGNTFDNSKIKNIGWTQIVSTNDGLQRHFEYLRQHPPAK